MAHHLRARLRTLSISIFAVATLFTTPPHAAAAARDSVGVFYKEDKVVILVNEDLGASRLQSFFNALEERGLLLVEPQTSDRYVFLSSDQTARIQCARSQAAASCTFRFLPSSMATIANRRIEAFVPAAEIYGTTSTANTAEDFEMTFESSMADLFNLKLAKDGLHIEARKRQPTL